MEKENHDHQPAFLYTRCMPEWWPALDAHKKILKINKGGIVFHEGDLVQGVYFMIEGVVKVHKHWGDEKELILRFAKEQDIIGHRGLSTQSNDYPISATALTKVKVCFFELAFFNATLKVNPGCLFDFMMFFADELRLSEQRMRDLAHLPVRKRVANTLFILQYKFGKNAAGYIHFPVSRQDIASYVGSAYETVYKILTEFIHAGFIQTNGKEIAILDVKSLLEIHA